MNNTIFWGDDKYSQVNRLFTHEPCMHIFFRETLAKEGIVRGLYAGTVPSLAANVAENNILFAAYGVCQKMVANATNTEVSKLSTLANGTSGEC